MKSAMRASALILNYNGLHLLEECFASLGAATREGRDHDVYLIDNHSTDASIEWTQTRFPWVKCIRAPRNAFLFSYNDVIPDLETEALLLLNNDIIVEPDFIEPLLQHLREPDVFAVSTRILTGDRVTPQGSRTSGGTRRGWWWYHQLPDIERASTTFFVPCQGVFSRSKLLELGGFDELFWPCYHEDIDLCYRAWRRGWRNLYEPSSVLYHLGGQSTGADAHDKRGKWRSIVTKNHFIMQWKNIDDARMRREHWQWLPLRLMQAASSGDRAFLKGFRAARRQWHAIQTQRVLQSPLRRVPDREVFERLMADIDGLSPGSLSAGSTP